MFRRARLVFALLAVFCLLSSAPVYAGEVGPASRSRGPAMERLDLRSPNAKVFQFADGSGYAQVYSVPIHFRSNDGSWQPINTQLAPLSGGGWATKASDVAVRFQARSVQRTRAQLSAPHTPLVSITQDSRTLQFEPLDASSSTAQVAGSEITYPNIYEGVDLQYETAPGMVKEALVLHKLPAQQSFRFVMRVTGITPQLDANGGITLKPCAETCWTILPPFMEDAGGATSDAVQVAMQDLGGGSYELTYTPDAGWLADTARVWPVVVDPTVNTSGGISTYVQQGYPNSTGANQRYTSVGYDPEGNGKGVTRSFFIVGLPGLPSGSSVSSASFNFYQYYRSDTMSGYTGEIRRVVSDWAGQASNITWNTGQPGVDGTVVASRTVERANGWKSWNITGLVQQWYSGTPNYGLALFASPESARGSYFCSVYAAGTQCGPGGDASQLKPYFTIDYQVNTANIPPNTPTLVAPAEGATTPVAGITLQVQDAGDPDNGPRNFRDFFFRIEKTDGSWAQESGWRGASWGITLPSAGSYRWRAMAGDGAIPSPWSAWRGLNYTPPIAVVTPQPPQKPSTVPFFWQVDPAWKDKKLGACTGICSTIGPCGCALTSTAMVFKFYGTPTDPGKLAECAGNAACELQWGADKLLGCSGNRVRLLERTYSFSWQRLESELKRGPVIIQVNHKSGTYMHFVVVTAGSGTNPANYTINDPALKNGAGQPLSILSARGYIIPPANMRLYGAKTTTVATRNDPMMQWASVPIRTNLRAMLSETTPITGSITLYENTELAATLELEAVSNAASITEMQVSTPQHPDEPWQPYSQYVALPIEDTFTVRFRDSDGQTTPSITTGINPAGSPPDSTPPTVVFLPLIQQ